MSNVCANVQHPVTGLDPFVKPRELRVVTPEGSLPDMVSPPQSLQLLLIGQGKTADETLEYLDHV
jgi:hypothetical protein